MVYIPQTPTGAHKARSNLYKNSKVETRKTKTRREDAMCLCSHEHNKQCIGIDMSFQVFNSMLENPLPRLSRAYYQSCTASTFMFKCIGGAYRKRNN